MEAHALQPAAAPHPVAADGVHHQRNGGGVDAVRFEVGALCHGAGHDGGCRGAEHGLEYDVHPQRDIQTQVGIIALNERVEPADEGAGAAEHQPEADEPVARGADAKIHHVFHEDIAGVLGAGETRFTQSKTRLHEVNEECRNQHPAGVYGVEHEILPPHDLWRAGRQYRPLAKPAAAPLYLRSSAKYGKTKGAGGISSVSAFAFDDTSIERLGQGVKYQT